MTTSFEPVLNVPALGAFLFIASIFVFLQWRIRSIEQASEQRTIALDQLRSIKAKALSAVGDDAIDSKEVDQAIELYRKAYYEVENLREVIPGVRIVQPPSQSTSRQRMDENRAAAQQFLGITPEKEDSNVGSTIDTTNLGKGNGLSMLQTGALVFIAISQVSLFFFLLIDPMTNKI